MEFDERRYRPLTTADLFDEAFDLYKKNFVLFLGITAVVVVPQHVLVSIIELTWFHGLLGTISNYQADPANPTAMLGFMGHLFELMLWTAPLYLATFALMFAALSRAVSSRYLDENITAFECYKQGIRRYLSSFVALFLSYLFAYIGLLFCFIGALYPLARYWLAVPSIVNEKLGPIAGLKRSAQLCSSDSSKIISCLILIFVITGSISSGLQGILLLVSGVIFKVSVLVIPAVAHNQELAQQIASGLADLLSTPIQAAVLTLLYFDERVRKEGYDIDILASRLGYPAPSTLFPLPYNRLAPQRTIAPVQVRKRGSQ